MTELLENGWVVVVKHDCPTCELVQPVLRKMADSGTPLQVFSQDDPSFPEGLATVVDAEMETVEIFGTSGGPTGETVDFPAPDLN